MVCGDVAVLRRIDAEDARVAKAQRRIARKLASRVKRKAVGNRQVVATHHRQHAGEGGLRPTSAATTMRTLRKLIHARRPDVCPAVTQGGSDRHAFVAASTLGGRAVLVAPKRAGVTLPQTMRFVDDNGGGANSTAPVSCLSSSAPIDAMVFGTAAPCTRIGVARCDVANTSVFALHGLPDTPEWAGAAPVLLGLSKPDWGVLQADAAKLLGLQVQAERAVV